MSVLALAVHHVARLASLASDSPDAAVQPPPEHALGRSAQAHGHRRLQKLQARLAEQTASSEALQEALQARVAQLEQLAVSAGLTLPPAPMATPPHRRPAAAAKVGVTLEAETAKAAAAGEAAVTNLTVPSRFVSAYVDKHNELRAKHCALPLVYDAKLAKQAEECAAQCPTGHTCPTQGAGENLAWHGTTTDGALNESVHSWETPVQDWYDEVRDYDWQAHRSINGRDIGHFTALVWKSSTKVGCALNTGCGNKFGAGFRNNAFVCRYFPAGNLIVNGNSTAPENVLLPGSRDCDQPALGVSALRPTEVTHAQTSFEVATTDECSCDRGQCKTNWRESNSDSCQASWSSSGTGPAGAPELMKRRVGTERVQWTQRICKARAMGCAASSRIQPHPAEVAKDGKATAQFERQLANARAAQEAPAAFPSLGPTATATGCASSQPVAPEPKTHALRGVHAGVQLGWLKDFVKQVQAGTSTLDVVQKIIKPATKERLCRYVLLAEEESPAAVGTAKIFASHTWRAPFRDLVAALGHVADNKDYVWIDIFAVLQWELEDGITQKQAAEKLQDLDFAAVVKATEAFVLVGTHVEAVAQLSSRDKIAKIVPPEAKELSAFFRVWCLVEMAAALQAAKPVVLLVGKAASKEALRFEHNRTMLKNLFLVMDVRQAAASREEDRVRILKEVDEGVGADALNTLARGAVSGALVCMEEREVLSSAMGNGAPLAALQEPEAYGMALRAAAAAGLMAPLKALLGRSEEVAVDAKNSAGITALMLAAQGGHAAAIEALLAAGAEVEAKDKLNGRTALIIAAGGGHAAAIAALLEAGAEVGAKMNDGKTALMLAAEGGHAAAIAALLAAGAEVEAKENDGATALKFAVAKPPWAVARYTSVRSTPRAYR